MVFLFIYINFFALKNNYFYELAEFYLCHAIGIVKYENLKKIQSCVQYNKHKY